MWRSAWRHAALISNECVQYPAGQLRSRWLCLTFFFKVRDTTDPITTRR